MLAAGMGGACLSVSTSFTAPSASAAGTPTWLLALSALGAFAVGGIMVVQAMLSRYTIALPVRRFIPGLFDKVSVNDKSWAMLVGGGSSGSGGG
jgi:hypothetical protein